MFTHEPKRQAARTFVRKLGVVSNGSSVEDTSVT